MRRALFAAMSVACLAAVAVPGQAQYKWESADGGVVYSDLPPPADARLVQRHGRGVAPATADADADLPFEVRSARSKHPVVLYTAADCAPCKSARELLVERGVPFSEKTIASATDIEAYRALGFADAVLPGLGVGRERTGGFEPGGWQTLLDAAGYPKRATLPAKYRQVDAQPLSPPAQRIEVVVRENRAGEPSAPAEVRPVDSTSAIERYRQAMQEAAAAQRRAEQPAIRF